MGQGFYLARGSASHRALAQFVLKLPHFLLQRHALLSQAALHLRRPQLGLNLGTARVPSAMRCVG